MRICLILVILISTLSFALGQVDDPHLHVRTPTYDSKLTIVDTDYFLLVNTDEQFLQLTFSSGYRQSSGALAITIEALFLAQNDLYKQADKREFSLIVDGDRFDLGTMLYSRYTAEESEKALYGGIRIDLLFPGDAQVRAHGSIRNLVVGHLDKFVMDHRYAEAFARVEKAKQVSLKIGPNRVTLTEGQLSTLRNLLRWRVHGR